MEMWIRNQKELMKMKSQGKRVFKSKFGVDPFTGDYEREEIILMPSGDELHVYLQEFGFLRKGLLVKESGKLSLSI